ncbi:Uncharacterised protein [uncultured archaeon]|nr:Uncharacterised protein [uncultured archaeon]
MVQLNAPEQKKIVADIGAVEKAIYSQSNLNKITSAPAIRSSFSNAAAQAATGISMDQISQMIQAKIRFDSADVREKHDDSKEELLERKAEQEESGEKGKESFAEEVQEKKEAILEAASEFIEERMRESESDIKESLEDVISVFEETGLAMEVESIHQMVEEGELELAKESVEELVESVQERGELIRELAGEIEGMSGDKGVGADGLAKAVEDLAEKDKSDFGKELEALVKDLKGMEKQEAIDQVKDFIDEHSRQLDALKGVDKLLDSWDRMSQGQIADALKGISKGLGKEMSALEKGAEDLQKLIAVPDDFIRKAKRIFAEDGEMLDGIRRKWIGAAIDFTKQKLFEADAKKDAKEREEWKDKFTKASKMKDKPLDDFNRSLAELMKGRPKDLQEARARADEAAVDHVRKVADAIAGGRYSERLDEISRMADKESMRPPLQRLASELHEISKRAEALLQKAEKGDIRGILDELGKPDGSTGFVGRVMIRTVDRNRCKAKKEMIKELLGGISMINGASRMAEGIQKAMERKDYELVDEMCAELKGGVKRLKAADKEMSALMAIKRMPRKERRSRIARIFSKLIFVRKVRPASG